MRSRGGEPDDGVAGAYARAVDDPLALDDADAEAGEVVVVARVHAGHFRRLAADQRAARLDAALGDAGDDALGHVDGQLAGRVIVEEEQRLRALHDDVVGAHRDQVLADPVVQAGVDREPKLGADAVRARNQHGALPASRGISIMAPKPPMPASTSGRMRAGHARLDALDEFFAGVDVDAGIPVGQRRAFSHSVLL